MESEDLNRELICVQFPGIVKNVDKAIECLGGIRNISDVIANPNKKRLGLNFQPQNPFIKKVYGDNKKTAGVLLRVKVKKTKDGDKVKREVVGTTVVGQVKRIYKYDSMCDFQYLPLQTEGESSKCIMDEILPSGTDNFSFMAEKSSLFVVPSNFTRSDKPINYSYSDKRYPSKKDQPLQNKDSDKDDVHNKRRSERGIGMAHYTFNLTDSLPTEPNEAYVKQQQLRLSVYPPLKEEMETIKKLFEERPVWSQNLLRFHNTKIRSSSFKVILPCVAIYMKDGPWRMQWVKYGYDPRKEPDDRWYQTLDFRLRHQAGVHSMVSTRDQVVHYKKNDRVRPNTRVEDNAAEDIPEGTVYFRPGMVPSQRQIFYQYCDVKIPEVEALLSEPPATLLCHARRGWLAPGTDHACRDHIFRYVKETLLATHNADLKLEQASSDDDGNSDDASASASANVTENDEPSTSNT